jgi:hypothetical protein
VKFLREDLYTSFKKHILKKCIRYALGGRFLQKILLTSYGI